MTILEIIKYALEKLSPLSPSARLDVELLLMQASGLSRSALIAWPNRQLSRQDIQAFFALLQRRMAGEPIAYILGEKEFWSLSFKVNKHTLIPRPETEILVASVLEHLSANDALSIVDAGVGCGAIAIALAYERSQWQIYAIDKYYPCLLCARDNAKKIGVDNVHFFLADWLTACDNHKVAVVISNPPYIALGDPHLTRGDLRHEPEYALHSGCDGLADIHSIIKQAKNILRPQGMIFLEHGYHQAAMVHDDLTQAGYTVISTESDFQGIVRVTIARMNT